MFFNRLPCHKSLRATYDDDEFLALIAPGIPDALELGMVEDLPTVIDTTVIIGFDLAITLSCCPSPSCNLFDTDIGQRVSKQQTELRLRRLLHSSRVKFPFVNVCELVFGVDVFHLDLRVQADPVKQPIKCNSVGERDTCLIIGLYLMIFFSNASLS